ncbi:MAG: hypothetical protein HC841_04320 [Verrucomicrobiae bacterium]|nr:hypothetical protein [Verrucomicrobiae bacterium]
MTGKGIHEIVLEPKQFAGQHVVIIGGVTRPSTGAPAGRCREGHHARPSE